MAAEAHRALEARETAARRCSQQNPARLRRWIDCAYTAAAALASLWRHDVIGGGRYTSQIKVLCG